MILSLEEGWGNWRHCKILFGQSAGKVKPVFVFQGCHHKLSQPWHCKTAEYCSFTILEVRSLKSRCWQDHASLASSGFWWLQAFLGLQMHNSNVCLPLHVAFSVFVSFTPHEDTCHWIQDLLGYLMICKDPFSK